MPNTAKLQCAALQHNTTVSLLSIAQPLGNGRCSALIFQFAPIMSRTGSNRWIVTNIQRLPIALSTAPSPILHVTLLWLFSFV